LRTEVEHIEKTWTQSLTRQAIRATREVPSLIIDESREMFSRSGLGRVGLMTTAQALATPSHVYAAMIRDA
jgi:hypothetical protein